MVKDYVTTSNRLVYDVYINGTVGEFWEVNRSGYDEWIVIMSIIG